MKRVPITRMWRIFWIAYRYGLDELVLSNIDHAWMTRFIALTRFGRRFKQSRGERLRLALESLGPIFVKFGQLLSTRHDLVPPDMIVELSRLQNKVPTFDSDVAIKTIETSLGKHPDELFMSFERVPVASASIAQVHFAVLHDGRHVAVKVLRPGMRRVIDSDLRLMELAANFVERWSADGRRLKPKEVVQEFSKYLHDELDLLREAANSSQLRRNFSKDSKRSQLLMVPEVMWDYCSSSVFTMQRMSGIPISERDHLQEAQVDIAKLARDGVEIFFTQVFDDGYFHADMHPGNIFVSNDPATLGRYIALDFGIVGSLSDFDKNYLAQNFLAFFQRDYRRVAKLHIESGWAPEGTREEELEGAIRACCEPIFDRPLHEISLGQVLLRLFQTSRRFNIEVQPQLVLLQKTLLNIEGLGRQLDPNLDLWATAKPYLERWMKNRIGVAALRRNLQEEAMQWSKLLPEIPRLVHAQLNRKTYELALLAELHDLKQVQKKYNRRQSILMLMIVVVLAVLAHLHFFKNFL